MLTWEGGKIQALLRNDNFLEFLGYSRGGA